MTDDERSADIENKLLKHFPHWIATPSQNTLHDFQDLAEDAVNELLGMYGYEGVGKDELKSSLKRRGITFAGNDLSLPSSSYHPYLHSVPINRLLIAATSSAGASKTAAGHAKANNLQKGHKSKGQAALGSLNASNGAGPCNAGRNLQLCQWCKKEKAQIVETLLPPPSSGGASASSTATSKLKFCSSSCLNAYKLDIFRRETEACLRNGNGNIDDSEPIIVSEKPAVSKSVIEKRAVESPSPKTMAQRGRSRKEPTPAASPADVLGGDLWTSAVGTGKKLAGRTPNACKTSQRHVPDRKTSPVESSGLKPISSMPNAKQQQRSKRRSAPPRPHPYYALNKKYWMTIRGSSDSREEATHDRDEGSNGDSTEDSRYLSNGPSSSTQFSLNAVLSAPSTDPKPNLSDGRTFRDQHSDQESRTPPTPKVEKGQLGSSQQRETSSAVSIPDCKAANQVPSTNTVAAPVSLSSLSTVFSSLPLNLVWIPVPVPIPLPVPIPIPLSGICEQQKTRSVKMDDDCPQD